MDGKAFLPARRVMTHLWRYIRYDWPLHLVMTITGLLPDNVIFLRLRGHLVRPFLKSGGKQILVGRDVTFYNPSKISLGDHVYIAKGCWFLGYEDIIIKEHVIFGPYVVIVTADHSYAKGSYHQGDVVNAKRVVIEAGSWIATHSTILSGSHIKRGCLIAANSVIRGDTDEGGVYGGVPAKKIKEIDINA